MRHWLQLNTRNWRAKPGRTAGALGAIALGVGVVIWVTCAYESVRLALRDQVWFWVGSSHLSIESVYGADGTVYQSLSDDALTLPHVLHTTYQLKRRMILHKVDEPASRSAYGPESGDRQAKGQGQSDFDTDSQAEVESRNEAVLDEEVQAVGIEPEQEYVFRGYDEERVSGRMLTAQDTDAAVIDFVLAEQLGLGLGDRFTMRAVTLNPEDKPLENVATFTIVGLLKHRRVAKTQRPVVMAKLERIQALSGYGRDPKRVTKIDIILDVPSRENLIETERLLNTLIRKQDEGFLVTSSQGKLAQIQMAERQTKFVLMLISTVALFTAFFIILSTLSMGMVERLEQLGTLRCLGMTRLQMSLMVLSEAMPMGLVGILLGIPVGFGLAKLSVYMAPEYIGQFAVNRSGLVLAVVGGVITTLGGALLPFFQAFRISPLAASRPQARPAPWILTWLAGLIGAAMITAHSWLLATVPPNQWFLKPQKTLVCIGLLYIGYALMVPVMVRLAGVLAVAAMAAVLRIRRKLLSDQVGRAVWRSSAICCGLMVGLSMIVTLVVHSASLAAGWDFPKNFCEAFVYIIPPVDRSIADKARQIPGVKDSALVNTSIRCRAYGSGLFDFPISMFVAGDPDEFFNIAKLEFVAGERDEAIAKLRKGGYIIVTPEFVRTKRKNYGDKVFIKQGAIFGQGKSFEIAGVVTSPALDIAANYFNAGDMLVAAAVHVVMGTLDDAAKVFKVPEQTSLFLVNFDVPATEPPEVFQQASPPRTGHPVSLSEMLIQWAPQMPERAAEIQEVTREVAAALAGQRRSLTWNDFPTLRIFEEAMTLQVASRWKDLTPAERWQEYREELVMQLVARRTGTGNAMHASVRALKTQIDHDLGRATRLCATIPFVALIVAALGVGNLMMANVTNRIRQIAMLRAVGATRWQISRLVIGETLVLGAMGSLVGIALGLHAASGINMMTEAIWGFRPQPTMPWGWLGTGIGFTLLICLAAGLFPARRAARTSIIDALHTT